MRVGYGPIELYGGGGEGKDGERGGRRPEYCTGGRGEGGGQVVGMYDNYYDNVHAKTMLYLSTINIMVTWLMIRLHEGYTSHPFS